MQNDAYDKNYFIYSKPFILGNTLLREPQIESYIHTFEHFEAKKKSSHAILVLPTGVGKTGLMGLLPYGISKGRVLIITPQLTIKDNVIESLDPENINNFWLKRNIFKSITNLPTLIEYNSTLPNHVLRSANIIILNIQKLQKRLQKSPLHKLPTDFFDMIIIDEAHHSTANTWLDTINHFEKAKVIKLTGTPIRTDKVDLAGELVYKYRLSQAMSKNYVKSLRNKQYVPNNLYFILDNDSSKKYTLDEVMNLESIDENWVSRKVAYSPECSEAVVDASIKLLEERKNLSSVPHKIIAVACTIEHAEQIKRIYEIKGYRADVIHSDLSKADIEKIKNDIQNHRLDVIVNVNMLGEGYDHPYLSIGAIFRPFRNALPYEQFIGRILRTIPENEIQSPLDNIADIVSHKFLNLDELWEKYKIEIQESEIIKHLQDFNEYNESPISAGTNEHHELINGEIIVDRDGTLKEDVYLTTELLRENALRQTEEDRKIEELINLLSISYDEARTIYLQHQTKETAAIKRPDLYFTNKNKNVDTEIKVNIVPRLITTYKINQEAKDLDRCRLFRGKYSWIANSDKNNGAMLAMYFYDYLRHSIGMSKKLWDIPECERALELLPEITEYVEKILDDYIQQ